MKKIITAIIFIVLFINMSVPAYAYNYTFTSGADSRTTFDKSTQTDEITPQNPLTENIRRNKDASYNPPPYGIFSGDIPTDQSSLYHTQDKSMAVIVSNQSVAYSDYSSISGGELPPAFNYSSDEMLPSTSVYADEPSKILPMYYNDGSIGTLSIPKLNINVKVYEGETLDNMKTGVGHFSDTSVWDGNVGIAGHNRGVPSSIGSIKNLSNGDKITYTTQYGTRTYEVCSKRQIAETDTSVLGWSAYNIINIITCVENTPGMRWCITGILTDN